MTHWTASDIPDQYGRTAVVTGAGGLGFEDALALARAGAEVVVAGRNSQKGAQAVDRIRYAVDGAQVRFELLDLASLASVEAFATRIGWQIDALDILINNAGVMTPPTRQETEDGFELQLGVNYLGHFALTGRLLPLLRKAAAPRVVALGSVAAHRGALDFDDLNARRDYRPMSVYSRSKLACVTAALELQRRSEAAGWGVVSLASHPGVSRTELLLNAPGGLSPERIFRTVAPLLFQPVWRGALPTLYAATAPQAQGGAYYGPNGFGEIRGYPANARIPRQALDENAASRLWAVSEDLTGVRFG